MNSADPLSPGAAEPYRPAALLDETFTRSRVTGLRHAVTGCARAVGLGGERLDDFVLAVNELITNAVRHGGGRGSLRLWHADGLLHCVVSDTGGGLDPARLDQRERPDPDASGGWGLWLARQLSDEMWVRTGPDGTSVRISTAVTTRQGEVARPG